MPGIKYQVSFLPPVTVIFFHKFCDKETKCCCGCSLLVQQYSVFELTLMPAPPKAAGTHSEEQFAHRTLEPPRASVRVSRWPWQLLHVRPRESRCANPAVGVGGAPLLVLVVPVPVVLVVEFLHRCSTRRLALTWAPDVEISAAVCPVGCARWKRSSRGARGGGLSEWVGAWRGSGGVA